MGLYLCLPDLCLGEEFTEERVFMSAHLRDQTSVVGQSADHLNQQTGIRR